MAYSSDDNPDDQGWLTDRSTLRDWLQYSTVACIPLQDVPSPVYPSLQAQVKEPTVLEQVADVWQLWVLDVHSSVSSD